MKRNIIYMVGALLSSAILAFSCSDDIPSYSGLAVDKNDLFIKIENHTATINITEGNGNYKVEVADENIATAKIEGDKIVFTAVKNGRTTATITDWSRHSTVINIRVKEDFELELDKEKLVLVKDANPTELIYIISGNGEYKVNSLNSDIATARLIEDGKIEVRAVGDGSTDIEVTDADGKKVKIEVLAAEYTFTLGDIPTGTWGMRESKSITIKSGNGEYTATSNDENIATVEVIENTLKITGHAEGEATITITDKMGFTQSVTVNVEFKMVNITNVDELVVGETVDIALLSGGNDFTIQITDAATGFSTDAKIQCTISDDYTKLSIKGLSRGWSQTIKLTDNGIGQSVDIKVQTVDVPFFTKSSRYFISAWFANTPSNTKITNEGDRERFTMSNKTIFGTAIDGWIISFEGGKGEGEKSAPVLAHINGQGKEDFYVTISNLRIVKVEGGWYWIKFREKDREFDSYMVLTHK